MNYILVKKSDIGDRFQFAPQFGDKILLPVNYVKVLAGVQVEIISHTEASILTAKAQKAQAVVENEVEESKEKEE